MKELTGAQIPSEDDYRTEAARLIGQLEYTHQELQESQARIESMRAESRAHLDATNRILDELAASRG